MIQRRTTLSSAEREPTIYRIPTRKEYRKKILKGDATWDQVYGNKKCYVCNEHFKEEDLYIAEACTRRRKQWYTPCRHKDCDPANPPKKRRKKAVIETPKTRRIYTNNKTPLGENVIFANVMYVVLEKGEDDEGEFMELEVVNENGET